MIKKYFYIILLIFFAFFNTTLAQKKLPDSIQNKPNKLKAIYFNAFAKKQNSLDSSLYFTKIALKYAVKSKNDSLLSASFYNLSFFPAIYGDFDLAIKNITLLDSMLNVKPVPYFSFRRNTLLAYSNKMKDQINLALVYYKKALNDAFKTKDSLFIADAYNNLGDSFVSVNLKTEAHKYFLKALSIFEKRDGNNDRKIVIYNNLSRIAIDAKEALFYSDKAFKLVSIENNFQKLSLFYLNRGDVLRIQKKYKLSKKAFNKALKIADSINFILVKNIALIYLGDVYLKLGDTQQSVKVLEEALKLDQPNLVNYKNLLQSLSQAYALNKDYKKAFDLSKKMVSINDSIFKLKSAKDFAAFDVKYNTEQKDKEIAKQHLLLAKQKINNILYIIVSVLILAIAAIFFIVRVNNQNKKKLLTEVLLQKEKEINEIRSKFLGNIAHEIRTPLTLILGNLELALDNLNSKEKISKNIKVAYANSKKVIEDANEILEFLKFDKSKTTLHPTLININKTIRRLFFSFNSLADLKKLHLKYLSDIDTDFWGKIDLDKLEKILNNLISNAIKYSASQTNIILSAKIEDNNLHIDLTDFGQGIHHDETEKIFQRFYQATNSNTVSGVGIGLSLARELAEFMKGSLTVKSKINKGSTFTLILPISDYCYSQIIKQNEQDKSSEIPFNQSQKEIKPSILIVEDNPEMSDYLTEILSEKYSCTKAFNGQEALDLLKTQYFDLITSDIMMPFVDGFKLRKKMNEDPTLKNIPFILLTAKSLTKDKIKGFKLGIDDYIIKPFNKNELRARIDNLLINKKNRQKWQLINKNLTESSESFETHLISKIEKFVLDNLSNENFKVPQLAKEIGYSQRQLSRILQQFTGMSPVKFILEIRLQKAYQLLKQKTYITLSEIRYDVGISSPNYFNKKFKGRFGFMPSDLLKKVSYL